MFTSEELLDKINLYLTSLTYTRHPKGLYEPISYVLSMGGKRLRPVLMLMAYNLYKENVEPILSSAAAIEIYHNYTLLHDDLMDRADKRRGKKTVHKVWGDNAAILSGDAMLVLAYQYMAQCKEEHLKEVMDLFSETALEICEGQQLDMEFETRMDVTQEEYIEMIRLKTSVLLAAALKIGALLAGAPADDAEKLYQFGVNMGLAFQLKDDWLDVYGDTKVFGKNIGGDILCNKKTYMLIKALQHADEAQLAALDKWLAATDYRAEDKIKAVTDLYNQIGVKAFCEEQIAHYTRLAEENLASVQLPDEQKTELKKMIESLMSREV